MLLREIMDPKYGMFQHYEESRLAWFNEQVYPLQTSFIDMSGHLTNLRFDMHMPHP